MRKTIYTLLFPLLYLTLFTTCKNPEIDYNTFSITEENMQPGTHTVMVSGEYSFIGVVKSMKLEIGLDDQLVDAESHPMDLDNQSFSVTVDNLDPNTSYHYCYIVEFDNNHKLLTEVGVFTTLSLSGKPIVRTLEVKAVDSITFRVKSIVDEDFGMDITERGICWGFTNTPTLDGNHVTHQENGLGEYTCEITGLELNTNYFVRAYAMNEMGISYAEEVLGFKTDAIESPTVETMQIDINEITQTSAVCRGRIDNEGSSPVTQCGIYLGVTPEPDNNNWDYFPSDSNENEFVVILTNLLPSTTYYFCAYAINNEGPGYGEIVPFTTLALNMFSIEVSCSPSEGGQVKGSGSFPEGQYHTVKAIESDHYEFRNWTENGQVASEDADYSFSVDRDRTLVANFSLQTYDVSVVVSPSNGGTVEGLGTGKYEYGQTCTLTARPNEGYYFKNWTVDGNLFSEENPCSFEVKGDMQLVANFTQVPDGGIDGLFSVGLSSKVYFSQGNLQYQASTDTWQFATSQWECLGNENSSISPYNSGWIDLFGWGSGSNPTFTGTIVDDMDWGENRISNGGNTQGLWRTMSKEEWNYVINERHASTINGIEDARFVKATVNNVQGVILFPDDFENPSGIIIQTNTINIDATHFNNNNYSSSQWLMMETKGCIFLPVTGNREGTEIQHLDEGFYWSYTIGTGRSAYGLHFDNSNLQSDCETDKKLGEGVRLVHDYR